MAPESKFRNSRTEFRRTSQVVNSTKLAELISDKFKIVQKSAKGHMYSERSYDPPNYRPFPAT